VLGALGLGFLMDVTWLLPLTAMFLGFAVGALLFRARRRRGYGPFALGVIASAIVLIGKFSLQEDAAMYTGLGLLVIASLWNSWPRRRQVECSPCST
jgi:mercuric ion transport protein